MTTERNGELTANDLEQINEASNEYLSRGFAYPIRVLTAAEAEACREKLEEYETCCKSSPLSGDDRFKIHLLLPWAWEIVHHPVIVELVRRTLKTNDVWCWSSDINIKEPESSSIFTWHQDSTYAGITPPSAAVTVWLALSPSTDKSGCLKCIPDSHHEQLAHTKGRGGEDNVLALKQEVNHLPPNALEQAENLILEPGEASIHSFLTVHSSGSNLSNQRRIGLAIRYVSATCTKVGTIKESATLVSGDGQGLFEPEPKPVVSMGRNEVAAHVQALEREKTNYLPDGAVYS